MAKVNLTQKEYQDFDQLVIYADLVVKDLVPYTSGIRPMSLEFATLQISASSFSIIFSIRELIKLGYFPSARILLRSLLDRTTTIAWIRENGLNGLEIWNNGWKYKERPENLADKLDCLHKFRLFIDDDRPLAKYLVDQGFIREFHGDSHGNLESIKRNVVFGEDGEEYYVAGPNNLDVGQLVYTCKLSSTIIGQFMKEIEISLSGAIPIWKQKA